MLVSTLAEAASARATQRRGLGCAWALGHPHLERKASMSQSAANDQPLPPVEPSQPQTPPAPAKSSWGRTLALTGVGLLVAGLFLGGLFKGTPTGILIARTAGLAGAACLLVGLAGVAIVALKKKRQQA
jgi:hypothetical protein